jgi:ADP-ribose pyrophosphatase
MISRDGIVKNSDNVHINSKEQIFDDFFKVCELKLTRRETNGEHGREQRFLVFERGDSVAVLIYNRDRRTVILTDQFKPGTLGKTGRDGLLVELPAGIVKADEDRLDAIMREAMEETGYRLRDPQLIAHFFSSPGGCSERVFLYFSEAGDADKTGSGGGLKEEGEDISVIEMPYDRLAHSLASGEFQDPKLLIGAYWLKDWLSKREASAAPKHEKNEVLAPGTARFSVKGRKHLIAGYKTGPILTVRDVHIWVNSENTDMMMDRIIGRTISANIRWGGAQKDENGDLIEDTIADALRQKLGRHGHVRRAAVIETEPGSLYENNGVRRILHVASVEGKEPGKGIAGDIGDVERCVRNVLDKAHRTNARKIIGHPDRSILIPMIGTGDGGLPVEAVAPEIVRTVVEFFERHPNTSLQEVYLLAFRTRDRDACQSALEKETGLIAQI